MCIKHLKPQSRGGPTCSFGVGVPQRKAPGRHLLKPRVCGSDDLFEFCGEHGLTADIELTPMAKINQAFDRLLKSDVKYRFVIDMASLK